MTGSGLTRRGLFKASGVVAGAGLVTESCSFFSTSSKHDKSAGGGGAKSKEAPMLASQVKAGKLPPVEKRLPDKPCVVTPFDENGLYGGTIRRTTPTTTYATTPGRSASWIEFDRNTVKPIPSMVEGWDVSDGGKTYTFHLRKGLKWSDGHPYTTDDVIFMMKNILLNTTLTPVYPIYWTVNGKPPTVKAIDELTFTFSYDTPSGLLPAYIAYVGHNLISPKHYMSQFHPDFTDPAKLKKEAKKAGFDTWDQYFADRGTDWTNVETPVMNAWLTEKPIKGSGTHAVTVRNPYYYKTDPAGRQLPYVDRITYDVVAATSVGLRISNGEVDLQSNNIGANDLSVMVKNAQAHNYNVYHWHSDAPWIALYMNQYAKDPVLRPLLQNRDFRQALSIAINRNEMNQSLYSGTGGIQQPVGVPEDKYFVKGSGKTFTEYDPDKANSLLDGLGLHKGGDGVRRRPDGKPLQLVIETFEFETGVESADAYEFVVRYWGKVGIKASMKQYDSTAWIAKVATGAVNIGGYTVAGFNWEVDPEWYVPVATNCYWAPLFGLWYSTNGKQGVKPTPEIHQLMTWYDQMKTEVDEGKRLELGRKILSQHDKNVYMIGTVTRPWQPLIANADLINVKKTSVESYRLGHEQATVFEQVAYKNPDQHT
ncbi:MAG TPA: ABC transporter substrate-binding protein [Mycobacteriales bacterium]|nr:ABC transporter substrate-binding protein [Mycobacteriales bacterium]